MNIYDFSVKTQEGNEVSLSEYKGKVLLVVNTATGCGFIPKYDELQDSKALVCRLWDLCFREL